MSLLFSPIKIGNLELKNRIVMPAMHLNYTMDGSVTSKLLAFYSLRAKGGAGLIQVGPCPVNNEAGGEMMINVTDDKYIDGMKSLSDIIHEGGAKCGIQLYHAGRYTYSFLIGGKQPPSASETLSGLTREKSREMTLDEIAQTITDFADCALRVKKAGFDIVEVIASAGYLINQFLSPLTNKRNDEYGGSTENRMRFGIEVVKAIKEAVGADFPVSVRLSGNDFVTDSNTNKENSEFAKELVKVGAAMFNVTGGWHETKVPQITFALPRGGFSYLARNVKAHTGSLVAASNRINTPQVAEKLLREGWCDLISVGRGLITDPEWPNKAKAGKAADIIQCIACNQRCLDNVFQLRPVGCLMNPEAGREDEEKFAKTKSKTVLIIGGGSAGLSAATTAAKRGHKVTVLEKNDHLGGQILAAAAAPGKYEFKNVIASLARQAELNGVTVELGVLVDEAEINKRNPDVLVIATGAKSITPPIPGLDRPEVVDAIDFLENSQMPGKNVVVIGGGPIGVESALYTAEIGTLPPDVAAFLLMHDAEKPEVIRDLLWHGNSNVTVIDMLPKIGTAIGKSTRWVALKEAREMGIKMITRAKAHKIDDEGIHIEVDDKIQILKADTIILAAGMRPENPFADIVDSFKGKVITVGDANQVADAAVAIENGYLELREL